MKLEEIHEKTVLKERLLNIAIMLRDDDKYSKGHAVDDLLNVINEIDMTIGRVKDQKAPNRRCNDVN